MADTQTALSDDWDDDDLPEDTDDLDEDPELIALLEAGLAEAAAGLRGRSAAEVLADMDVTITRWMANRA